MMRIAFLAFCLVCVGSLSARAETTPPVLVEDAPRISYDSETPGTIELELLIDEAGEVVWARVVRGLGPAIDREMVRAAVLMRFLPAQSSTGLVPAIVRWERTLEPRQPIGRLTGTVVSRGLRRPIAGARVLIGGVERATADHEGRWALDLPVGDVSIQVVAQNFRSTLASARVTRDESAEVLVRLTPVEANPYQTTVVAQAEFEVVSRTPLSRRELREAPGAFGDAFRAVMQMPGVASVGQAVAYPVVRGTQPAATATFIDGVRVPMLFHLGIGPSVISTELLEGIDYVPGAAGASWGRHPGGVISAKVARPREDRLRLTGWADLLQGGFAVEAPFESTGTSITAAGRVSWTGLLVSLATSLMSEVTSEDESVVANFGDWQLRVDQKLGPGRLRLFVFGSYDEVGFESDDPESLDPNVGIGFHRADLRWEQPLAGGRLAVGTTAGLDWLRADAYRGEEHFAGALVEQSSFSARTNWAKRWRVLSLRVGADVARKHGTFLLHERTEAVGERGVDPLDVFRRPETFATVAGAWLETELRAGRWTLVPGVRADGWFAPDSTQWSVDPRLAVSFAPKSGWRLHAATGLFHQPPTVLVPVPVAEVAGLPLGLQSALQSEVGLEWKPLPDWRFELVGYYNRLLRTVELDVTDILENRVPPGSTGPDPSSFGRAWGIELSARKALGGRWFGWASYAFQRSERIAAWSRHDAQGAVIGQASGWLPFAFEQRHVINAAASFRFGEGWTAGFGAHFNTGRPETGMLSSRPRVRSVDDEGNPAWVRTDLDRAARLPAYFRFDARIAKTWVRDEHLLEVYLDIYNVLLTKEVVGWLYFDYPRGEAVDGLGREPFDLGRLILPMLGVRGMW